jgi:hypothetical protein
MERPNIRENIGKSLLDVAKLTFASFILGGILRGELPQYILILIGAIVSTVCFTLGILWTSEKPKKGQRVIYVVNYLYARSRYSYHNLGVCCRLA